MKGLKEALDVCGDAELSLSVCVTAREKGGWRRQRRTEHTNETRRNKWLARGRRQAGQVKAIG